MTKVCWGLMFIFVLLLVAQTDHSFQAFHFFLPEAGLFSMRFLSFYFVNVRILGWPAKFYFVYSAVTMFLCIIQI